MNYDPQAFSEAKTTFIKRVVALIVCAFFVIRLPNNAGSWTVLDALSGIIFPIPLLVCIYLAIKDGLRFLALLPERTRHAAAEAALSYYVPTIADYIAGLDAETGRLAPTSKFAGFLTSPHEELRKRAVAVQEHWNADESEPRMRWKQLVARTKKEAVATDLNNRKHFLEALRKHESELAQYGAKCRERESKKTVVTVKCSSCNGAGTTARYEQGERNVQRPCRTCGGAGRQYREARSWNWETAKNEVVGAANSTCPRCNGSGVESYTEKGRFAAGSTGCYNCKGTGYTTYWQYPFPAPPQPKGPPDPEFYDTVFPRLFEELKKTAAKQFQQK